MILREFHCPIEGSPEERALLQRLNNENVVISAPLRQVNFGPHRHTLSLKAAWRGAEHYVLGNRRIAVDDDTFLVLNAGQTYTSEARAVPPVHSFSVFFRPSLAAEICGAASFSWSAALDMGTETPRRAPEFAEHLRPHDDGLLRQMKVIRDTVATEDPGDAWLEAQLSTLLVMLLDVEAAQARRSERIDALRSATRRELLHRVARAQDHIHTHYARPLSLDDLASAACLSKFHLLRLFRQVNGVTPLDYVRGKRTAAAMRLIESSTLDLSEIAERTGFGNRSSLFRQLRERAGASGRVLRQRNRHSAVLAALASDGPSSTNTSIGTSTSLNTSINASSTTLAAMA